MFKCYDQPLNDIKDITKLNILKGNLNITLCDVHIQMCKDGVQCFVRHTNCLCI